MICVVTYIIAQAWHQEQFHMWIFQQLTSAYISLNSKYCAKTSKGKIRYSLNRLDFPSRICPAFTLNPLSPCNETYSQSFHKARQLSAVSVFSGPSLCKIYSISCLETVLFWNSALHSILCLSDHFTLPTLSPLFWLTPKLDSTSSLLFFLSVCPSFSLFCLFLCLYKFVIFNIMTINSITQKESDRAENMSS